MRTAHGQASGDLLRPNSGYISRISLLLRFLCCDCTGRLPHCDSGFIPPAPSRQLRSCPCMYHLCLSLFSLSIPLAGLSNPEAGQMTPNGILSAQNPVLSPRTGCATSCRTSLLTPVTLQLNMQTFPSLPLCCRPQLNRPSILYVYPVSKLKKKSILLTLLF